ncbi:nucleotide-binding universal stress UspA family protein [Arthrobacter ulcerisalmonis]|uniref:universal stress protein n=1 Tax=Arthrobacter sp. B1I2 TaxID=3042263 RepID=UPI00277F2B70|nr:MULTISPECIES: universal stress protein [Arthrobacter]MDQ0664092.1 nucleotide-binding universal stress UspA family protein [Arthrobacter ulcerisalmonis]MDQ0731990.1 nucleotide-binding universal stress UspA family protein [Arthrobacter sp. B1I2]
MTDDAGAIVAGYDGSDEAAAAVRWASRHARATNCPLHVVHCSMWPLLTRHLGPVPGVSGSGLEQSAQSVLEEGVSHAAAEVPGLEIRSTLLHGLPAQLLAEFSAGERLLVVGSRGLGGFLGLLVGSVSLELAATAACPVAVIRDDSHPAGPVVAAVDASGSPAALEDACAVASAWNAPLTVVHVRHVPAGFSRRDGQAAAADAREVLGSALKHARTKAPEVSVDGRILTDSSVPHAILTAAREARIVVVGSQGQGILRETIGSTAHAVLHHARGPVLISRHAN